MSEQVPAPIPHEDYDTEHDVAGVAPDYSAEEVHEDDLANELVEDDDVDDPSLLEDEQL